MLETPGLPPDRYTHLVIAPVTAAAGPVPVDWDPLAPHRERMAALVVEHGGLLAGGDAAAVECPGCYRATFAQVPAAVATALALPSRLLAASDPTGTAPQMRMALHSGDAHRCAQLAKLGHGGQVLLTRSTAAAVQPILPPGAGLLDLGTHQLRDLQTSVQVYQLHRPDQPADFGPLLSLDHLPHNLPAQLTSFVGRAAEMAWLGQLLGGARLLTLTGTGGIGKTRLALQVAAAELDRYPAGAWLVELAPIQDPALLPQAVATSLGLREVAGRSLRDTLVAYLQPRHLLLVLDNCEHLADACADLLPDLLRTCPQLQIMATSREALGVGAETVWPVPPLAVPEAEHPVHPGDEPVTAGPSAPAGGIEPADPERMLTYAAVQLFTQRAMAVQSAFRLTPANAAAVGRICRRLDGMSLAIELAAARVKLLSVQQIAERLEAGLTLLAAGGRKAEPRHQTLWAAITWSHEALSEAEKQLWRRLAVFAGGFTLAAAAAVAGAPGSDVPDGAGVPAVPDVVDVLDLLGQLVDKSLVLAESRGAEVRYRLLEPLRQYAYEQLQAAGEVGAGRDRHLAWCLELAEQAAPELARTEQGVWLERLEQEHDNLRSALAWALAPAGAGQAGTGQAGVGTLPPSAGPDATATARGVRLAAALGEFWEVRGHLSEGRRWLTAALAVESEATAIRAELLDAAGLLARGQSDLDQALVLQRQALALQRRLGDRRDVARSLLNYGRVLLTRSEFRQAQAPLAESLAAWREVGDAGGIAASLHYLAVAAIHRGEWRQTEHLLQEALERERDLGNWRGVVKNLDGLGTTYRILGDFGLAVSHHREGLRLARELNLRLDIPHIILNLAVDLFVQDGGGQVMPLIDEALTMARSMGRKSFVGACLGQKGLAALQAGDIAGAAAHLENALTIVQETGDRFYAARWLHGLGLVARARRQGEQALDCAARGVHLCWAMDDRLILAEGLEGLAGAAIEQGRRLDAARWLGAAAGLRAAMAAPVHPVYRPALERDVATLRTELGAAAFAAAWAAGETQPLAEVVAAALATAGLALPATEPGSEEFGAGESPNSPSTAVPPPAQAPAPPTRPAGLTPRELEVALLVAEGLTDREVAARLHISPRTVDTHLRNIFTKAEVTSRAGLATWLARHGVGA